MGAPTVVLMTIRRWSNNKTVLATGINCLSRLFRYSSDCPWTFLHQMNAALEALFDLQAVETIVAAMKSFPNSGRLQMEAITALDCLLGCDRMDFDKKKLHTATVKFASDEKDGPLAVLKAMREFPDGVMLQVFGCRFLCKLCEEEHVRVSMRKAGLGSTVAASLEKNPEAKDLQEWGGKILPLLFPGR